MHQDPKNHYYKPKQVLSMINRYNLADLNLADRPIEALREGFGSCLPSHNSQHERRYFSTEYRMYYGGPQAETAHDRMARAT